MTSRPPAAIELHIEQLVLEGVAPGDRHAVADAVQRQLLHLFTAYPSVRTGMHSVSVDAVDGGQIALVPGSSAEGLGERIGSAIFNGVRR